MEAREVGMSTEVKVLIVGPKNSGKSALANFIADAVQNSENPAQAPTQPTKGCRIVEFDRQIPQKKGNVSLLSRGFPAVLHAHRNVCVLRWNRNQLVAPRCSRCIPTIH